MQAKSRQTPISESSSLLASKTLLEQDRLRDTDRLQTYLDVKLPRQFKMTHFKEIPPALLEASIFIKSIICAKAKTQISIEIWSALMQGTNMIIDRSA